MLIWLITLPGWRWFIVNVFKAETPDLVFDLVSTLTPFYAFFAFAGLPSGVLYALGRTDLLAGKAAIGNVVIATLFVLFDNGILFIGGDVFSVAYIFGVGLVLGTLLNVLLLAVVVKKNYFL